MKSKFGRATLSVLPVFFLASVAAIPAQEGSPKPIVIHPTYHDVSPPLRDMVAAAPFEAPTGQHIIPLRATPPLRGAGAPPAEDRVLQTLTLPLVGTINGLNFNGVTGDPSGVAPPDTNGSVGNTQFVQITNFDYAIFDKATGNTILGPTPAHTIWNGFGGNCGNGSDGGDPVVVYDKAANRWVISQLPSTYNGWCMAVSQTSDATGSYYRYEFEFGNNLPDYPKLGVWPDAYYWSSNTFQNGSTFIGAQACAFDRANMLSGGAANAICFQQNSSVASLLPSDLDGSTAPPSGEPNLYLELYDTSHLGLFKFHADFTTPPNSTFTGPTTISVATYAEACGGGVCIPQEGTTQQLDSLGDRLMFRNAYRNLKGTEYLVSTHSVTAGTSVGTRWYQITNPNGTPTVAQQGTFAPDSSYRWMGSIAMDKSGDIAVGYSVSSSSIHPSIFYTGRVPSDPSGMMESEANIYNGTGSQTRGLDRWGDYSSISIDPVDDCTFWYTNEYIPTNGSFNWNTRIGSFKFTSCGITTPDFSLSGSPSSQTITQGKSTTYTVTVTPLNGYSNTVNLSVSAGCPTGSTCTFSPTSVMVPPAANSSLTVQTTSTTPGGTYTLTIRGTDGTLTHTTTVTLVVIAPDFSISSNPTATSVLPGGTAKYTETLKSLKGFSGNVTLGSTGCPPSSTCSFIPNPVNVPSGGSATSTFRVATTKTTPKGHYSITVKGTHGSLKHSVTVMLSVL